MPRAAFALVVVAHGLVHLLGAAKGFGLADLEALSAPISPVRALGWLVAAVLLVTAGILVVVAPRGWWMIGAAGALASQLLILTAWSDAKAGTVVNLVLLGAATWTFAAHGPWGLRAEGRRVEAAARTASLDRRDDGAGAVLHADDIRHLPEPIVRYLRRSGAVGAARPVGFRATWRGRIRGGPDEPWMTFVAEQQNTVDPPSRVFFMDARRGPFPVDVLHRYDEAEASMRVRLLSLFPMVAADGPGLHRTETVTFLNDLALLAPGALVRPSMKWSAIDATSARVRFAVGADTVSAILFVDEAGDLVDFVSDDRAMALPGGGAFERRPWSTPLEGHGPAGPFRLPGGGRGIWRLDDGDFVYIEMIRTGYSVW